MTFSMTGESETCGFPDGSCVFSVPHGVIGLFEPEEYEAKGACNSGSFCFLDTTTGWDHPTVVRNVRYRSQECCSAPPVPEDPRPAFSQTSGSYLWVYEKGGLNSLLPTA
jgi:hypothetical protein